MSLTTADEVVAGAEEVDVGGEAGAVEVEVGPATEENCEQVVWVSSPTGGEISLPLLAAAMTPQA